jgi:hypothetical protein
MPPVNRRVTLPIAVPLLVVALAVAACGGSSTTGAPTVPSSSAPEESQAPASEPASQAGDDGAAPSAATGPDLSGITAALDDLSSYQFTMTMAAEGTAEFMTITGGGSMSIEGTIVLEPDRAVALAVTSDDGSGATVFEYRIVGDQAYTNVGGNQWIQTPASDTEMTITAFRPETMLAGYAGIPDQAPVGDEDRNGIPTTHYHTDAATGFGTAFGMPEATWSLDTWVARDGGYLVASELSGESADGKFTLSVDIKNINAPDNAVEAPENVVSVGG